MDYKKLLLALFVAVQLASCGKSELTNESAEVRDNYTAEQQITEDISTPEVLTSPLSSTVNYLEPLDDFSWEMTEKPEYVVLHFTSDVVASRDNPYNLESVRKIFEDNSLSIHYIIDREGNIHSWLPETRAAWHAGKGEYLGVEKLTNAMNKYSIGIEMLAIGSANDMKQYLTESEYNAIDRSLIGYTDAQYESVKLLVKDICDRNGIPFDKEHILGHDEYNPLKTDPGELFDWSRLFE